MADQLPEFEISSNRGDPVDVRNITGTTPGSAAPNAAAPAQGLMLGGRYNGTTFLPVAVDQDGKVGITTSIASTIALARVSAFTSINAGATVFTSYTAAQKLGLKQFYAGGTGVGRQTLYQYMAATSAFINEGDFETPAAINTVWTWISGGTGSIASSTAQFFSGARSVALTFSNSSGASAQGVKQTFATPVDYSAWRYISSQFYNVVSAGGAYTRTISIILTDSAAATRTYTLSGLSTAAPFNASGWIQLLGEIENPTSATGTSFDVSSIASIELRMTDSANRAGTVYWDAVKLTGALTVLFPIYHLANLNFNIAIDPIVTLNIGDQILIAQKNNDTTRKEYFAEVSGIAIT